MRRVLQWSAVFGVGALAFLAGGPAAEGQSHNPHVVQTIPDELLVGFHPDVSDADADAEINAHGAQKLEKIRGLKVHRIKVPPQAAAAIQRNLEKRDKVAFVEPNRRHSVQLTPNDPSLGQQWQHTKVLSQAAWDITTGTPDIIIGIADTGVDGKHPDLAAKLVPGANFYNSDPPTVDTYGHGTMVAGMAAAISNNSVGVAGMCWQCRIMPLRISDPSGFATSSAMANALTYGIDHGARVLNLSFSGVAGSATVTSAARYVVNKGGVVVAAAGNCGCTDTTPDNQYIISVSATTSSDALASFSSRGNLVDVAAPGALVYTTRAGGSYTAANGTSFASPLTAGVVALMLTMNPALSPEEVDTLLKANADEKGTAGWDPNFGYGRINAYRAVAAARDSVPGGPQPSPTPAPPPDTIPPANVTAFSGTVPAPGQVALAWTNPTDDFSGTVILMRQDSPVAETPLAGQTYTVGQAVGSSTVVYSGSTGSLSQSSLLAGVTYHYKAFSFDAARNYAEGVTTSVTQPASTTCPNEVIVDNLGAGKSSASVAFSGTWAASSLSPAFGLNASLYIAKTGTYTWNTPVFNSAGACNYEVFVWWTANSSRSAAAPYTVTGHQDGSVTKMFDQRSNGGKWNSHGVYAFPAGSKGTVQLAWGGSGNTAADAVRFVLTTATPTAPPPPPPSSETSPAPANEIIVDNGGSGSSFTGNWCTSSASGSYGSTSLYSCGTGSDTYRWTPNIGTAGQYDVYLWWTVNTNRSSSVPVSLTHAAGVYSTVVDQKQTGGQWVLLGRFSLNGGTQGFLQITDANGQASADAARFVYVGSTTSVQSP